MNVYDDTWLLNLLLLVVNNKVKQVKRTLLYEFYTYKYKEKGALIDLAWEIFIMNNVAVCSYML